MAPSLGNTTLEMVRAEKHVGSTPYVMDGETEALRRNLSHGDFGVESVIGLNFQLRKKKIGISALRSPYVMLWHGANFQHRLEMSVSNFLSVGDIRNSCPCV